MKSELSNTVASLQSKIVSTVFVVSALFCLVCCDRLPTSSNSQNLSEVDLDVIASEITVRIFEKGNADGKWGSGFLVQREGELYTAITNRHVLSDIRKIYNVQTFDGQIYSTNAVRTAKFDDDVAVIQFYSPKHRYRIAILKSSDSLSIGDKVFAGGFPFSENLPKNKPLKLTVGQIDLIPSQPLIGGYQLGYTNIVEKGMSGGPLLNSLGEVVGLNGRHKYPVAGDPFVFKDGSKVSEKLWQHMSSLSWALPIQKFTYLIPNVHISALSVNFQ
ncbi:MAG: serine protease [bacterium]|nr:serine protease [bacterium]